MSEPIVHSDPALTSDEQIVAILRDHAGLNPEDGLSRTKLIALCRENGIKVEGVKSPKAAVSEKKADRQPTSYKINITGSKDKPHVIVGLNGKIFQIKTDTDVVVPVGVYEILRNAKRDVWNDVRNDLGQVIERTKRSVPAHPVSVVEVIY